jgi:hypothetical protein
MPNLDEVRPGAVRDYLVAMHRLRASNHSADGAPLSLRGLLDLITAELPSTGQTLGELGIGSAASVQNIFHPNHWHATKPEVVTATVRALGGDLTTMMDLHAQAMREYRSPPREKPRQRRVLLLTATSLLVAGAIGVGTVLVLTQPPSTATAAPPTAPAPTAPAPPTSPVEVASPETRIGEVINLEPDEGYDFDFGDQGGPEERPGLDISGQATQYWFDSLATTEGGRLKDLHHGGRLKRLPPRSTPYEERDCDPRIPGWTKNVPGVPIGKSICVITSDGNIALLTITKPWTGPGPDERRIGFTYRIWYATPS